MKKPQPSNGGQATGKSRGARKSKVAARAVDAAPELSLPVALSFLPQAGGPGPTKLGFAVSSHSLDRLRPDPLAVDYALWRLGRLGFRVARRSAFVTSARIDRARYERLFRTVLTPHRLPGKDGAKFLFPEDGAPWAPPEAFANLFDDAYIQWPARPQAIGPAPLGLFGPKRIYLPDDLTTHFGASPNLTGGRTGRGVRVAMVDSGFGIDHPYFANRKCSVVPAGPEVTLSDLDGHGTAMSANLLALAPDVDFIGVGLGQSEQGISIASLLEGVQTALSHGPDILVLSIAYDLRGTNGREMPTIPASCVALALELQSAIQSGVTVVCAAGNGEFAFPAMLPDVIAVGGAVLDDDGDYSASDITSGFASAIYPGRSVPDLVGLGGSRARKAYLMLPCPAKCRLDIACASLPDGTAVDDGWCFTSGSSAAAPQIAGLCALLLEAAPSLSPSDLKSLLQRSARDVARGRASRMVGGPVAGAGWDTATGAGIPDLGRCLALI